MKSLKMLVIGFAAGASVMACTTAVAKDISALLMNDVTFVFDGERKASPSDQPVLNYNGYTYVPIRYVSEQLGCKVDWDIVNRKVLVQSPAPKVVEKIVEVEVPVYVEDEEGKVIYAQGLPLGKNLGEYKLTVTGMNRSSINNQTKVFVTFENDSKSNVNYQIVQNECKLVVDGETYDVSMLTSTWDQNWYNDINPDTESEGYLIFDLIPEDYSKVNLTIAVRENGTGNTTIKESIFNFIP